MGFQVDFPGIEDLMSCGPQPGEEEGGGNVIPLTNDIQGLSSAMP